MTWEKTAVVPYPSFLRCQLDRHLAESLRAEPVVARAIESVSRDAERSRVRRQLLATSVRLSPELAPELNATIDLCKEKLQVEDVIEPYVYPSATVNAGVARPEEGRVFILFSSAILDRFKDDELMFVVGHELAHHAFAHHDIPVGPLITSKDPPVGPGLALRLFAWSRAAEISADRGGLYCCESLAAVGRSLFKLASGLSGTKAEVAIETLLEQVEEWAAVPESAPDGTPRADWFATHPFGPLRVKAAKVFADSAAFRGEEGAEEELERQTAELLSLMDPSYTEGKTNADRAMRRVLLAGGMLVAAAAGGIDTREAAALDELLGEGTVSDKLSVEALREDLPSRLRDLRETTPPGRRGQVVRDLCLVALADCHVDPAEREVLVHIATEAGVGPELVDQTLGAGLDLD